MLHKIPLLSVWLCLAYLSQAMLVALRAAPSNDDFLAAQKISDVAGTQAGTNTGATLEPGEPALDPLASGNSVWYRWVAPRTDRFAFNTLGSTFDTVLAVYLGTNAPGAGSTIVATNNDIWIGNSYSQCTFGAVSNQEYRVVVDGIGASGELLLNWSPAPLNDQFSDATLISGEAGSLRNHNIGATREEAEPSYGTNLVVDASVWYRWTAPRSGWVTFDTADANFDTVIGVFAGASLSGLQEVALNDNNCPDGSSVAFFEATAGMTYSIAVNSRLPSGIADRFVLRWAYIPGQAPANDQFSQAEVISGATGLVRGVTFNATQESGEPLINSNTVGATTWYRWTPDSNGRVVLDAARAGFNTRLALYTGQDVTGLALVTNNVLSGFGPVVADVQAGTAYSLMVDGFLDRSSYPPWLAATGHVSVEWLMVPPTPVNDQFASATALAGLNGSAPGSNLRGSKEDSEPMHHDDPGGASTWFRWTAPSSRIFTFDTAGSGFDTLLAIYTGNELAALNYVASSDDQQNPLRTSSVSFLAAAGTEYRIAVDGYKPYDEPVKEGRFVLNWGPRYVDITPAVPLPELVVARNIDGAGIVVSWPEAYAEFTLQLSTNLQAGSWLDLTNDVFQVGGSLVHTNTGQNGTGFYRLIKRTGP